MEDGLLPLVDAALVAQRKLPVGAVEAFTAGEALDLGEVGYGVERDEVVQHQVRLADIAAGVLLEVRHAELVPLLEERLHFLEAYHGRRLGHGPRRVAPRVEHVGEAREHLTQVAQQRLEGMEQQPQLVGGQATLPPRQVVVEEILEQVVERGRQ